MRRMVCAVVLAVTLLPWSAVAGPLDLLEQDLQHLDRVLQAEEQAEALRSPASIFKPMRELFPVLRRERPAHGVLAQRRMRRTAQMLSVDVVGMLLTFHDIPRLAWYAPYVRSVVERRLMNGFRDERGNLTGEFGPGQSVTVAELAKISVLLVEGRAGECAAALPKNLTASGSWSAPFVACAEQRGLSLFAEGSIDVTQPAKRAEVVATLLEAMHVPLVSGTGALLQSPFTDVGSAAQFAPAVLRAAGDHVVEGYTDSDGNPLGTFGPDDPVTRAEFAKIVSLALGRYGSATTNATP